MDHPVWVLEQKHEGKKHDRTLKVKTEEEPWPS
jgi:hypothetical protein